MERVDLSAHGFHATPDLSGTDRSSLSLCGIINA